MRRHQRDAVGHARAAYPASSRPRRCDGAPRREHGAAPRGLRPHARNLSRDHDRPVRGYGVSCRHTHGLEEVWSARHVGNVRSDSSIPLPPAAPRSLMSNEGASVEKARTAPEPDDPSKPDSPTDLKKPSWIYTAKKSLSEFTRDQCTDLAASLTYYAVLALFPALLALVSLLGVFGQGQSTVNYVLDLGKGVLPADVLNQVRPVIDQMVNTPAAGFALVAGLLGALWSASGYVGAFGRALNRILEVDEGRPIWKLRPVNLLITLVVLVLVAVVMVGLVVSGPVAEFIGGLVGLGDTSVAIWNIAKWPVILLVVMAIVALLYHFTPNVRQPKFRWVSVGAAVAILVWVIASAAFGFYVANFGSYNKTYGALAGVIVFLLWLWLTNVALMFGAEVDAELERSRQLQAGIKAEETLQLPPRDTANSDKAAAKRDALIEEGRQIRLDNQAMGADAGTADARD